MKNNFFKVVVSKLKNALFWGSNNFLQSFSSKTKNPLFLPANFANNFLSTEVLPPRLFHVLMINAAIQNKKEKIVLQHRS